MFKILNNAELSAVVVILSKIYTELINNYVIQNVMETNRKFAAVS